MLKLPVKHKRQLIFGGVLMVLLAGAGFVMFIRVKGIGTEARPIRSAGIAVENLANTAVPSLARQLKADRRPNRLIREKSPYLLQHAFNPVDWFPWGEEAFEKARREHKPIFLSVGYSTCYWCHVMERLAFENGEIAAILNEYFVSIKVDREERPDVDRIYMSALLAISGSGGWPMSVFLTADLEPFFGGTYFPPEAFRNLLERIHQTWLKEPDRIRRSSQELMRVIKQQNETESANVKLEKSILTKGFQEFQKIYDDTYAGFGEGQKFPRPVTFNFLLHYYARFPQKQALDMTLATLSTMARSGIYDHLGGGFHRYSVDRQWRVPHFEKMLYDQAQLVWSYIDAYQITEDEFFASTARATLEYLLRDLKSPEGGFYSAQDAESAADPLKPEEKQEGAFYVWTRDEIVRALGEERAKVFSYIYGVQPGGNALQDPQGVFKEKNILYIAHSINEAATKFRKSAGEIATILAESRSILHAQRAARPQPHLDDKILVSWNGLAISALARAYQGLDDVRYLQAAEDAANFIRTKLYDPKTGRLLRRYRDGEARYDGYLEDYAFLTLGLLDLYEAYPDIRWLKFAVELTEKQNALFYDRNHGGFFDTSGADRSILLRTKEDYDGAEPAGNSIATWNLLRLSEMTNHEQWREMADRTLASFGKRLQEFSQAMPQMLVALDLHLDKPKQVIIAGNLEREDTRKMLRELHRRYLPNKVVLLADGGEGQQFLAQRIPTVAGIRMIDNRATAYVCENYTCQLPTPDVAVMARLLEGRSVK